MPAILIFANVGSADPLAGVPHIVQTKSHFIRASAGDILGKSYAGGGFSGQSLDIDSSACFFDIIKID